MLHLQVFTWMSSASRDGRRMPPTPESASAVWAHRTLEPTAAARSSSRRWRRPSGGRSRLGRPRRSTHGAGQAGADVGAAATGEGGVALDPEPPPVHRERSSAIRSASLSSSPELPSEWLPVLYMLAGARDWTDTGKGSVGEWSGVE
jgi:hypothetical protein